MANPKRSQVIKLFLEQNTHPDLAELYHKGMEVQVLMAQDGGQRIDNHYRGKNYHSFTDGVQTWKTFRIPAQAWTTPEDNDVPINFELPAHVEGIGLTGWDWQSKLSRYVAFDFDAMVGHSEKHTRKLTDQQLEEVQNAVRDIDYVTLRHSTGGKGLHIYVFLGEPVATVNHIEHMAVARSILGQLSVDANFDFKSKVDVHGAVMWVWHRKMATSFEGRGLKIIKQGSSIKAIPPNWRDHMDVVKGKKKRIVPFFIAESDKPKENQDEFEELSGQRIKVPLDGEHRQVLDWIKNQNMGSWWDEDHHMLVTHTATMAAAHKALRLKGVYRTISQGTEEGDYNCFAFPLYDGVWVIRRYTPGVVEDPTWTQDGQSWTYCYFNRTPDFDTACKAFGGIERPNGGYQFSDTKILPEISAILGVELKLPERLEHRTFNLKKGKDGRVIIEVVKNQDNESIGDDGKDWLPDGKYWKKVIRINNQNISEVPNFDKYVRHIVTETHENFGWVVRTADGSWKQEPLEHVKLLLKGTFGMKLPELEQVAGSAVMQPWTLVNQPFDDEFLPGRKWNRNAVKFMFERSQNMDNLNYPTWLKIFNHLGKELDIGVQTNPWAKTNNIHTGCDYLLLWVAALFQRPLEQLPYLFFWSKEQATGKSTFHEAISLLISRTGAVNANNALDPGSSFNGELQTAILCYIEEKELNKSKTGSAIAYNRIKEWVTAKEILIHHKGRTPYMMRNTTHYVHCANSRDACPIFPGDKRIVVIYVNPLDPIEQIPRTKLHEQLIKEAPDFLAMIMNMEIPESNERLILPVIGTEEKSIIEEANMSPVELFIREHCFFAPGEMILWKEFYQKFMEMTESHYLETWTKTYTGRHLPPGHPLGRGRKTADFCVGNISWTSPSDEILKQPRLVAVNRVLYKENEVKDILPLV